MIAFAGVVVDDVEDHFESGGVERFHHLLELADLSAGIALRRVLAMRREVAIGVITPVVAKPFVEQVLLVHELVDRQQFDRGHAERRQVLERRRVRQPGVGAANRLRDIGMPLGESLQMHFVDDRLVQLSTKRTIALPVKGVVHDDGFRHVRRVVLSLR